MENIKLIKENTLNLTRTVNEKLTSVECEIESLEVINTQINWIMQEIDDVFGNGVQNRLISYLYEWNIKMKLVADLLPRVIQDIKNGIDESRNTNDGIKELILDIKIADAANID